MTRPIFSHEVSDPDFQWLLDNYAERNKCTAIIDSTSLPVVLILLTEDEKLKAAGALHPLAIPEIGSREENDPSDESEAK